MTRRQSSFVSPSGLTLAVHDWGGEGAPVLLAHPTGFHGVVWEPVAEGLVARDRRVWSFDFRGHGDSDPSPDGRYSWHEFADDADAVLDHLGLRGDPELLVAGHSKGGASLLTVAHRDPTALARIWTFEPIVFPSEDPLPIDPDNPMSVSARKRRAVWSSRDEAFASFGARPPLGALRADALRAYVDYGMRDRDDGTVELKCRPEHEAAIYMMGAANGLYALLDAITAPTLVACGGDSRSISPGFAARLVERMPDATLQVWPGHGHFGPLEDPDRGVRSMLDFGG
ncbi:MAG: alpha/beta fold hydrolase [Acidimicrobiia bacterium]